MNFLAYAKVDFEFSLSFSGKVDISVDVAGILGDAWRAPKVGRCRVV